MWWQSQEWQWGQRHSWGRWQRYLWQCQCSFPCFPRTVKRVGGRFPWSSRLPIYSNVPSCLCHPVLQMLMLLAWFPFAFQVAAFFRLKGCFDNNIGMVLVISSLLWWISHIHTAFEACLSFLGQPLPGPNKNHHCKRHPWYDQTTLQACCIARFWHRKNCKFVPLKTCLCHHWHSKKEEQYEGWNSFPPVIYHMLLLHNCLCSSPHSFLQEWHKAKVWTRMLDQYINKWLLSFNPRQII